MEEELSFVLMLSLKEMAMRRVVVNLWKQPDILCRFRRFYSSLIADIGKETTDKMSKLMYPESLMREMSATLPAIGLQIEKWIFFHRSYLGCFYRQEIFEKYFIDPHVKLDVEPILAKLCFTTAGTVDYRKTAEEIIHSKMLDIVSRYRLACFYCLDDCIPMLWKELSEDIKSYFYDEDNVLRTIPYSLVLQFCWPYILNGEVSKLDYITPQRCGYPTRFYQHAFIYAAQEGNKSATKYFLGKLTPEEKEACLARIEFDLIDTLGDQASLKVQFDPGRPAIYIGKLSSENRSDGLCYLLSQMNRDQQMEFFKKKTCYVLSFFLTWHVQDLFLKIVDRVWAFLSAEDIKWLLRSMYKLLTESKYCFAKFFQNFFPLSPVNFRKEFVAEECREARFLSQFFELEDSKSAEVVFRNVSAADRMRLVSSERIFEVFFYGIWNGKSKMVKLCLQEATLSKEDSENLKAAFVAFNAANRTRIYPNCPEAKERVQNRFFQLLDRICGENKRDCEDETLNKAKKLCSNE